MATTPNTAKFSIVLADPPWSFRDKAHAGRRGASYKYPTMTLADIKSLPVSSIADSNCTLFLWVPFPQLPEGLDVIRSWGFKYKTVGFIWVKTNKRKFSLVWGLGSWTRSCAEICLLAIRGKRQVLSHGVHSVVVRPVMAHSVKPPEIRHQIVKLLGDLPRVELFARENAPGWASWGNQVKKCTDLFVGTPYHLATKG